MYATLCIIYVSLKDVYHPTWKKGVDGLGEEEVSKMTETTQAALCPVKRDVTPGIRALMPSVRSQYRYAIPP